ncbi:MAG: hemin uptake protein HemP [Hyphomicrobium sp.]|uniref:hemin uptake protein HemP n=1 Tax=Hyphomicrobium sp. TaxID=82 RepID=UPI003D0C3A44
MWTDMPPDESRDESHESRAGARQQEETGPPPRYRVSELMQGRREAIIEHNGANYILRITSNGRLILTK